MNDPEDDAGAGNDNDGDPRISRHIVLPAHINSNKASALYDPGSNGSFVSTAYARFHKLPMFPLAKTRKIGFADGDRPAARVTHKALINVTIGHGEDLHEEQLLVFVYDIQYDLILGLPWSEEHSPDVQWKRHTLVMNSRHCSDHCNHTRRPAIAVSSRHTYSPPDSTPLEPNATGIEDEDDNEIIEVSLAAIHRYAHQPGAEVFTLWVQPMGEDEDPPLQAHATGVEDYEKFMAGKPDEDPRHKLPERYHDLAEAFSRKDAEGLPEHRPGVDHEIHLKDKNAKPVFRKPYNQSNREQDAIREWVRKSIKSGLFRKSSSPFAAPVIVVRKPGGGLRVCVDYRALNTLTVKNSYPIPLIRDTLARIPGKKFFTKLDVIAAFNRIRVAEGHEWLTAFNTRYGQFECLVMPFGLCNAPATFQSYINETLREFLDDFASAYLDDVLIFSDTLEEHEEHVRKVIEKLHAAGLQIDVDKCEFHVQQTKYLGLIITTDGIQMDPAKVAAMKDWESPKNIKDVQAFLGFANYYRQFIYKFSKVAAPLTDMTRGLTKGSALDNPKFEWTPEAEAAFQDLKSRFLSEPILRHFDPSRQTMIESDANDNVIAAVVSQKHRIDGRDSGYPSPTTQGR